MLEAYFDASERKDGSFCVAGIAYGVDRAKKAARSWRSLWGETRCHMTDLHTRKERGAFANWTPEQAGSRLRDAVALINRHASFVVAVSCNAAEVNALSPKGADPGSKVVLDGFSNSYALCCHLAMRALAKLANGGNDIAYFFESGDEFQAASQRFMAWVAAHPEFPMYKLLSHTVLSKADCRMFEASDIAAWEWAKHMERLGEAKLTMRGSLRALIGEDCQSSGPSSFISKSRRCFHVTGQPLVTYYQKAHELGLFLDSPPT